MNDIPPLGRQAIEHARRGEFEQAIATARQAVDGHPSDFGLRIFMGMLHVRRGELGEALPHLRQANALAPADAFARVEFIRVLIGVGELDEASALLDRPGMPGPQSTRLRALLLHRRGDLANAEPLFRQLVEDDPQDFESWGNLGVCLLASERPQAAIQAFDRSLSLRPDRLSIRHKWAEAHHMLGTGEEALNALRQLAASNQSDVVSYVAIAHLEGLLSRQPQALEALEEAVRRDGANAEALSALAEKLEQQNDMERYETILGQLAALPEPGGKLPILKARLAYRLGKFDEALNLARDAPPSTDVGTRAQLIGQSLDRIGDPAGAFEAFEQMNREDSRTGAEVASQTRKSRDELAEQRSLLTPEWLESWAHVPGPERLPAFLVGFPRSGTTLLDTLLMGHPDVAMAEEEPMLSSVGERLGNFARLADLNAHEIGELRNTYFQVAGRYLPDAASKLLIDKNPLAMGSMPIVHRLFPDAPVIFMERHPCDVVLSCFMMRFQPTGIGTNFLTLRDTALLYDEMMQLWTRSTELLPLRVYTIRYERLVEDLEGELRPLAAFLGLSWLPEILDHRDTAKKRSFIKTPSYAQVTEPVTKKAVGRWTRYREQLESAIPILEPWVTRLGYEL
jgi:tetratricopeptide (TPR) repeat protein